ncbi:Uncharacterized conserved protein YbbK, DUF523 family [Malonomonas rubra DSM 5091]|uniref:Uncharacterized conserved protein YbbK, DUF523 family n=1 Tax=Malonomonas rubra DSM 5091 TaxID=1122189 RepID=A0A1M6DMR2_MALRU|nr:DUF523 domain-containing protein [Malonomonas rubra]SHI74485.1 Uncharacterized conserved protein YbbK, DUF523 family [Malonomonas rubra DSM 5091]
MAETIFVSSCLLGLPTRYDGTDNICPEVIAYLQQNNLIPIPVCPEQLAGLPTPRLKCWFRQGTGKDVLDGCGIICDEEAKDVTGAFAAAAEDSLKIAELTGCKKAILKQRSPSCGSARVHQNGQLVTGMGVTAAKLVAAGIEVLSEEDFAAK